jgi:hypothetical protein
MNQLNRRFQVVLIFGLLLTATMQTHAGGQASGQRPVSTWAARSGSGQTFGGTYTATEDAKTGAVTGSWTLLDAQGRSLASGAWSAAKSPSGWTGNWRAVAVGRPGEYTGTWTASPGLKGSARFADLFAKAAQSAVSGTWRARGQSGSWTIQTFN